MILGGNNSNRNIYSCCRRQVRRRPSTTSKNHGGEVHRIRHKFHIGTFFHPPLIGAVSFSTTRFNKQMGPRDTDLNDARTRYRIMLSDHLGIGRKHLWRRRRRWRKMWEKAAASSSSLPARKSRRRENLVRGGLWETKNWIRSAAPN